MVEIDQYSQKLSKGRDKLGQTSDQRTLSKNPKFNCSITTISEPRFSALP